MLAFVFLFVQYQNTVEKSDLKFTQSIYKLQI